MATVKKYIPKKIPRDEFIFALHKQIQDLHQFQTVKVVVVTSVLLLKAENTGQSHGTTQDNCAITLSNIYIFLIKCTTVSQITFYFSLSFSFFVVSFFLSFIVSHLSNIATVIVFSFQHKEKL